MGNTYLQHVGVLGMHWGRRKGPSNKPSSGRKTGFGPDGRKVNRLFGAVNRKKIRNFLLGDPHKFVTNFPIVKKKYASLSKEDKAKMEEKASKVLATVSVLSMVAMAAMLKAK